MDELLALWLLALEEVTSEQIRKAMPVILRMKAYGWPKPADVLEAIQGQTPQIPSNARAINEWRKPNEPQGCDAKNLDGITEELQRLAAKSERL